MSSEKNYTIDVLKKLVNIPSINPPGKETRIAEYIAGLLKEIEIPFRVDNIKESRANVTGFLNGPDNGPVLVLNGHLDTVPVKEGWNHDPFAGEISGNKIFGLGTSDMKGAIASMICAAKKIKESKVKLKGSLILSFVADADVKKEITSLLKDIEKNDETFKYSCEIFKELSSWKAEDNSRLLKYAFRVFQERFHKKPELTDLGATCEAALFAERGIDTLVFGPGNIKQAHTKDEFVEISQLKEAAEYYYMLIREILT